MEIENIVLNRPQLRLNMQSTIDVGVLKDDHIHSEIELLRVDIGNMVCHVDNKQFSLAESDIMLVNKNVIHKFIPEDEDTRCTYIQIDLDHYLRALSLEEYSHLCRFLNNKTGKQYEVYHDNMEIKNLFVSLHNELRRKQHGYEQYALAYIYLIIAFMFRNDFIVNQLPSAQLNTIKKIMPSITYIEKNYSHKISLEEISNESNMSKFHLCKLFKEITGSTLTDYINFIRLYHVENLLKNTDMDVFDIALKCGFNSIQYFYRIFRREKKCTPKKFRELIT